jgi:hypothetical protein
MQFTWSTEALYRYQVQYSNDLVLWKNDLPNSLSTAATTGVAPLFTDLTGAPGAKRFYRVAQLLP